MYEPVTKGGTIGANPGSSYHGNSCALFLAKRGSVVWRPISANTGLNFKPGFFFFYSKAFHRTIVSSLFRASNHQNVDKKN